MGGGGGTHRQIGNQPGRQEDGRGANREGEANALSSGPLGIAQHLPVYAHVPVLEGVPPGWSLPSGGDAETGEREGLEGGSDARGLEGMQVGKPGRGGEVEGEGAGRGSSVVSFASPSHANGVTVSVARCHCGAMPTQTNARSFAAYLLRKTSIPRSVRPQKKQTAVKAAGIQQEAEAARKSAKAKRRPPGPRGDCSDRNQRRSLRLGNNKTQRKKNHRRRNNHREYR